MDSWQDEPSAKALVSCCPTTFRQRLHSYLSSFSVSASASDTVCEVNHAGAELIFSEISFERIRTGIFNTLLLACF